MKTTSLKALEAYDRAYRPFVEEYKQVPAVVFPDYVHHWTAFQRWLLHRVLSAVSKVVVEMPWVLKRIGLVEQEDFKLPSYPAMERVFHMHQKVLSP